MGREMKEVKLDNKDRKLLKLLAENAETPLNQLAREIGLSRSATWKRIRRMKKNKVLSYTISVNPALLGREILAFVLVGSTVRKEKELVETLSKWPEICEIHELSSEGSGLLLKVRTRDHQSLARLKDRIAEKVPEACVRILEVTRTRKETPLPI